MLENHLAKLENNNIAQNNITNENLAPSNPNTEIAPLNQDPSEIKLQEKEEIALLDDRDIKEKEEEENTDLYNINNFTL